MTVVVIVIGGGGGASYFIDVEEDGWYSACGDSTR